MKRILYFLPFAALILSLPLWPSGIVQQAYNLIESAGSAVTMRSTLNFVSGCTAADNSGSNRTDVTCTGGGAAGGTNTQTGNYTLVSSDSGKLVIMNCSSACTLTLLSTPSSTFYGSIVSIGSSVAGVSLNSLNYNGAASAPVLISFVPLSYWSDGTNYFGTAPGVAGTNITFTPASNGNTIAASGGGGSSNGNYFFGSPTALISGNWSTIGTGCTTSFITGPTGASNGALKIVGSTGTQNACGEKITETGNYTHTFVFFADEPNGNFSEAAVGFTDGTKLETCGLGFFNSNNPSFSNSQISYTALSGGTLAGANGQTTSLYGLTQGPTIIQLVKSGSTLTCNVAADGQNFVQLFNDTTPFLTPTALVAITDPRGNSAATTMTVVSFN